MRPKKTPFWLSDTLTILRNFPEEVKDSIGYALHQIEEGKTPRNAKTLTGFKPSVMELIADFNRSTYRMVYTVKIGE